MSCTLLNHRLASFALRVASKPEVSDNHAQGVAIDELRNEQAIQSPPFLSCVKPAIAQKHVSTTSSIPLTICAMSYA